MNNSLPSLQLYDHQKRAIEFLSNGRVLVGGVGSGKTLTAIAYAFSKIRKGRHPMVGDKSYFKGSDDVKIYIITTARKRYTSDWERESAFLYFVPTVDSWNNIHKYTDIKNAFFIFDEQRLVGNGLWVKSFYKITKHNRWILLTATPGDTWMEYIPLFVANGFYKNKTDFERQHVVWSRWSKYPKVERYTNIGKLIGIRNSLIVKMYYEKKTRRHNELFYLDYDKEKFKRVLVDRWNVFKDRPVKNSTELIYTLRRITNSSNSRLEKLKDILEERKRIIVFYNFDYELYLLEEFCRTLKIKYAQWNGHKHELIPTDMGSSWLYLCQYTSASEAWSAKKINTVVFFSQNYSYKILEQATGRIDRLNTLFVDLYYYHFVSYAPIDLAIRKALENKKTFNESAFQKY